jgi:lipopolysaccharide transport system permease protein
VDFVVGFVLLAILMLVYRIRLSPAALSLPLFLLVAMGTAFGFGLWFAALNVRYRDVKHLIPVVIQTWMYVTPVVYGTQLIPERFRWLLGLNPMTGVVEGFRWALLGSPMSGTAGSSLVFWLSLAICSLVLISGLAFFRRTERTFADVI